MANTFPTTGAAGVANWREYLLKPEEVMDRVQSVRAVLKKSKGQWARVEPLEPRRMLSVAGIASAAANATPPAAPASLIGTYTGAEKIRATGQPRREYRSVLVISSGDARGNLAGTFYDGQAHWTFDGTIRGSRFTLNLSGPASSSGTLSGRTSDGGLEVHANVLEVVGGIRLRGSFAAFRPLPIVGTYSGPSHGRLIYTDSLARPAYTDIATLVIMSETSSGSIGGTLDTLPVGGRLLGDRLSMSVSGPFGSDFEFGFIRGTFSRGGRVFSGRLMYVVVVDNMGFEGPAILKLVG